MNRFKIVTMTAAFLLLAACSGNNNGATPSPNGNEKVADPTKPLKKSSLSEKDVENLSVWRFYRPTSDDIAGTSPDLIGYSEDNRFYARMTVFPMKSDSYTQCEFHMISKVEYYSAGNVTKMKIVGEPEFIFSYGIFSKTEDHEKVDSIQHPEQKELAEKLCFESVKAVDVGALLSPRQTRSAVDVGTIFSRSNSEVALGVFATMYGDNDQLPNEYRFERMKPGAWDRDQNCASAKSTCLP